ncbi:flagellar basal-body rod protein FlgB [Aliiruegeria haliotis]|uniref:Flagellar basal-body rod protein FlgB n=1 Tax=Aliiruegeria haliotis TaxID=1280846 RepID=A0A2T0RTE0_9RHOB|nr:FlgB family protein [Aliiruegeria haliotis]PRY24397.1 flagellar basal-body rod protein FlgB [Aliiruegeria haliotis]
MFEKLEIFRMAQGLSQHAASRQAVVARNIAHADTPGYRARDVESFQDVWGAQGAASDGMRRSRAGHVHAAATDTSIREMVVRSDTADPNGNTVSLETEIVKSAEVRQQHDMALSVYRSGMNVLRASLGRG